MPIALQSYKEISDIPVTTACKVAPITKPSPKIETSSTTIVFWLSSEFLVASRVYETLTALKRVSPNLSAASIQPLTNLKTSILGTLFLPTNHRPRRSQGIQPRPQTMSSAVS